MKYEVKHNQNLLDAVLQVSGSVESWVNFAQQNNLSITSILQTGQMLDWNSEPAQEPILKVYRERGVVVATGEIIDRNGDFNQDFNNDFNNG